MIKIKPKGYGAWTPKKVEECVTGGAMYQEKDGLWYPAKPETYRSFFERMRYAWDVLTYKAEPLYWYFEKGMDRKTGELK